jgi:hypothetical protein
VPSLTALTAQHAAPPVEREDTEAAGGLEALLSGTLDVEDAFDTLARKDSKKKG